MPIILAFHFKMKTAIFIPISFILFLFTANSAPDSVLDTTGKNLRPGINYYAIPAARNRNGGGIALGLTTNTTCPLGVGQFQTHKYGSPLTFSPVNPKKGVIRLSTDLNIKFTGPTTCNQSNIWKLQYDESITQYFVMAGGVQGNPGRETLDDWFKIEKTNNGYKFVFCPTVCNVCKVICRDVGVFLDGNGTRRLALRDVPFSVIFKR